MQGDTQESGGNLEALHAIISPFYQDEAVTIYNADCRQVLPFLPRCNLLLTDPPYGIDAANMTMGKGQSDKPRKQRFAKKAWDQCRPDISPFVACCDFVCIWGGNYFSDMLPPTNDWLVWHKLNDGRSFSECEMAWTNFGRQSRVYQWSWLHGGENKLHPTQKPLPVMRWCIGFAPQADTVLDPFMGSGTTLLAAVLEGRRAIGIEQDPKYCEIAANRLRQKVLF